MVHCGSRWRSEQLGRKHGLELKAIYAGRIRPQQLLASGEVPFVVATGTGALSSHILGVKDQVIVLTFINKVGSGILSKPDIKNPEDLKGKTIATGRPARLPIPWFDTYCAQSWALCRTATSSCCLWGSSFDFSRPGERHRRSRFVIHALQHDRQENGFSRVGGLR